ncbi:MAG TPA: hypothetical protein VLC09_14885 [Polyangiaceae bacterium]|nr:hypothetical protein [Polyangiaceae bacterium]
MRKLHILSSFALITTLATCFVACSESSDDGGSGGGGSGGDSASGGSSSTGGSNTGGGGAGGEANAPQSWLGQEPHLELVGHVDVEAVALSESGAEAADLGTLYCERNYIVPDLVDKTAWPTDGYLEKVEFKFNFFHEGELAEFQLELVKEDLGDFVGQTLDVGDDIEVAVGLKVNPDDPNEVSYEDEAASGTVELELLSGEVGADGLSVPDGTGALGAFVNVTLASGKKLVGSFTANCGDNDFEVPE